jgi:hypothetical protein
MKITTYPTGDLTFQRLDRRSGRRTPCGKKRYRSESEALSAAKRLRRYGYPDQRSYQCSKQNCSARHLTTHQQHPDWQLSRFLATAQVSPGK